MNRMNATPDSRGQVAIGIPPDERRCTASGKDGERCRAWASHRVLAERGEQLCSGHGHLGTLKQDQPMLAAAPPQGTSAVPSRHDGESDFGSAARSNGPDGDRVLARHELRRILRDRRAPHAARVSAARALDEMAARERSVETGRVFREHLAYLETVPLKPQPRAATADPPQGWIAACPSSKTTVVVDSRTRRGHSRNRTAPRRGSRGCAGQAVHLLTAHSLHIPARKSLSMSVWAATT